MNNLKVLLIVCVALALYITAAQGAVKKGNYNTQFVVGIDRFTSPQELANYAAPPPDRNTTYLFKKALEYFQFMYGLDFFYGNTITNATLLQSSVPGYRIYSSYGVPTFPDGIGNTDVGMHDDSYSVLTTGDLLVFGSYGGPNGTIVKSGSYLVYGYYTIHWRSNGSRIFPPIKYYAPMPMVYQTDSAFEIGCMLESTVFGNGMAKGGFKIKFDPVTNQLLYQVRAIHTFPGSFPARNPCRQMTVKRAYLGTQDDDIVLKWNSIILRSIRREGVDPPRAARAMAIIHDAIHEALEKCAHKKNNPCTQNQIISYVTHTAHAAATRLFLTQQPCFDQARLGAFDGLTDAEIDYGSDGAKIGINAIRDRDDDGSWNYQAYVAPNAGAPNQWQPTQPVLAATPAFPQWPYVKPFGIKSSLIPSFRQGPPPQIGTSAFQSAFDEVYALGEWNSTARTPDQSIIARFWADDKGTSTPPGHWNHIAQHILRIRGEQNNPIVNAQIFRLLNYATFGASIVAWDHKYTYNSLRPVTAAHIINPYLWWRPMLTTPNHPDYTSGHSTFSGASGRMLGLIFGTDDISFRTESDDLPWLFRSYNKLSDAVNEAGKSRIYGGIHFEYANAAGKQSGKLLAEAIWDAVCQDGECFEF